VITDRIGLHSVLLPLFISTSGNSNWSEWNKNQGVIVLVISNRLRAIAELKMSFENFFWSWKSWTGQKLSTSLGLCSWQDLDLWWCLWRCFSCFFLFRPLLLRNMVRSWEKYIFYGNSFCKYNAFMFLHSLAIINLVKVIFSSSEHWHLDWNEKALTGIRIVSWTRF